ncbi:MAG: hypothetical protein JWM34_1130 [Ilumatobacteraceae bacterium]|nr:hypothetical protein [Ilumatobacteraceae bacterium]
MAGSHARPMTSSAIPCPTRIDHPSTGRTHIGHQLSSEWQHRTVRAADLRRVRAWQLPGNEITSLDDVLDRCGFRRTVGRLADQQDPSASLADEVQDAYLIRLLELAREDDLAARIVLQRILPALSGAAKRRASAHRPFPDVLDDLVANAWAAIRTYPVDRRPRRVVANLVRDIGFQTFVRPARRRSASELPVTHDDFDAVVASDEQHPMAELLDVLAEARRQGALSTTDLRLLGQLIELGRPEHLAAVMDVTPRTIRNHRDAILHRVRAVALPAA